MKKEYVLIFIVGLFLLSYLLEAVVDPLNIAVASPYGYLKVEYMSQYPFTTAVVVIRSIAVFLTPLWLLTWIKAREFAKGAILLVLAGLMQLYAIQDLATNAEVVTLEWSLSLAFGGMMLLIPAVYYVIRGMVLSAHHSMVKSVQSKAQEAGPVEEGETPEWLSE